MNSIFSFQRFGNLMKKQFAEYYKAYLMGAGVLVGLMTLACTFIVDATKEPLGLDSQRDLFNITLMIVGAIFTSASFTDAGEKKQAIYLLTLPATLFEKYLVRWVISYLVFLVVFIVLYYIVIIPFAGLYHGSGKETGGIVNIVNEHNFEIAMIYYSLVHSLMFFGAIFFRKIHLIKTAFSIFGILVVLNAINSVMIKQMLGLRSIDIRSNMFATLNIQESDGFHSMNAGPSVELMVNIMWVSITLVLWTAAYFRLKEKQV